MLPRGQLVRNMVLVGDSLQTTGYIAESMEVNSNYRWISRGQKWGSGAKGTRHQGDPGWTYKLYDENVGSPFAPGNIESYVAEIGVTPHEVVFFLGLNDCFNANPANPDPAIDIMFGHADIVHGRWASAFPGVRKVVCTIPEPSSDDASWAFRYPAGPTQVEWNTIRARLNERIYAKWSNVIELHCDPVAGYDATFAIHPNRVGAVEIGSYMAAGLTSIVGPGR